jgi:hypothetical protein
MWRRRRRSPPDGTQPEIPFGMHLIPSEANPYAQIPFDMQPASRAPNPYELMPLEERGTRQTLGHSYFDPNENHIIEICAYTTGDTSFKSEVLASDEAQDWLDRKGLYVWERFGVFTENLRFLQDDLRSRETNLQ